MQAGNQTTETATMKKALYLNNTMKDVSMFHLAIVSAIENGGVFDEDLADIFSLTKAPVNSACEYILDFA
jgi:hypothetical protein